jgi:hypothetical protein
MSRRFHPATITRLFYFDVPDEGSPERQNPFERNPYGRQSRTDESSPSP